MAANRTNGSFNTPIDMLLQLRRDMLMTVAILVEIGAANWAEAATVVAAEKFVWQRLGDEVAGPAVDGENEVGGVLLFGVIVVDLRVAVADDIAALAAHGQAHVFETAMAGAVQEGLDRSVDRQALAHASDVETQIDDTVGDSVLLATEKEGFKLDRQHTPGLGATVEAQ